MVKTHGTSQRQASETLGWDGRRNDTRHLNGVTDPRPELSEAGRGSARLRYLGRVCRWMVASWGLCVHNADAAVAVNHQSWVGI